jgi:hypothetical protein
MGRGYLVVGLCLLPAWLGLAGPASASNEQQMIFHANNELVRGSPPGEVASTLDEMQDLGVDVVRVLVYWHKVAPNPYSRRKPPGDSADPSYYGIAWGPYDTIVAGAHARGMRVLMTIGGPFPKWASRSTRSRHHHPVPSEYFDVIKAAGLRYGGNYDLDPDGPAPPLPRVDFWALWNEPNVSYFLGPQKKRGRVFAAGLYRALFRAGKRALNETGHGEDETLIGETSPKATPRGPIGPLSFARAVLCLSPKKRCPPLDADGWAHHPYSVGIPPFVAPRDPADINSGNLGRLQRVLDLAARRGTVRPGLPLYLTEFGVQSRPDPFTGVNLVQQAEYRSIAEYLAWRNPRVMAFSQYLMRDDPPQNGTGLRYGGFESGIRFSVDGGGGQKPAYQEFRLPLVVQRAGAQVWVWGHVRPAGEMTTAKIQVNDGGSVNTLREVQTDENGYFGFVDAFASERTWRLVWDDSRAGETFVGPFVRAYQFR